MTLIDECKVDIEAFAKKNAGRILAWTLKNGPTHIHGMGRIVGYRTQKTAALIVDGHKSGEGKGKYKGQKFTGPHNIGDCGFAVIDDVENNSDGYYAWLYVDYLFEFKLAEAGSLKAVKLINDWPHKCPRCAGPAYIGFLTTVDCKEKCENRASE